jgi:outer membrane lipoprotein-sorting protein
LLALVVAHSELSPAADTNAVIDGWLNAQTNLQSWQADFIQTRTFKTLMHPLTASGHVWFASPNRFRWELGSPAQTIALRRSDEMIVVYPMLKRAERYPLTGKESSEWRDVLALLEAGFPGSRTELERRFRIELLTETNAAWQLVLQPTSASARKMIKQIHVGLATNDFSLTSTELVFADDSRMRNDFTNAMLNPSVDDDLFDWKPDPDFKVTEPLAK